MITASGVLEDGDAENDDDDDDDDVDYEVKIRVEGFARSSPGVLTAHMPLHADYPAYHRIPVARLEHASLLRHSLIFTTAYALLCGPPLLR